MYGTNNIKVFGIEIWSDLNETLSKNYTKKNKCHKKTLKLWNHRKITMYGRILITKALVLSQFNYLLACLPSPQTNVTKLIDSEILQFIRSYKTAQKISKDILALNKNQGGLKLTTISDQIIGLKLTWIKRLCEDADSAIWKKIVNSYLPLHNNDF